MPHPIAIALAAAGAYLGFKLLKKATAITKEPRENEKAAPNPPGATHRKHIPTLRKNPKTGIYEVDQEPH